jgi:hypothetical protein
MYLAKVDYYIICLNFNFNKLYIIWVSDETDSVVIDELGKVLAFTNNDLLLNYASKSNITLNEDQTIYDIDKLQQWLIAPTDIFDCELFLNFWNLCTDISVGLNKIFLGDIEADDHDILYNKLFDGAGTCISEDKNEAFDAFEIDKLRKIIQSGLALLLDNLAIK